MEFIQVLLHQSDSRPTNLHFSPWWEPGINNASANRWVSLPPIIFPPHLLTFSAAKVLENKLKEEDGDSNGGKTEEGSNNSRRVGGWN